MSSSSTCQTTGQSRMHSRCLSLRYTRSLYIRHPCRRGTARWPLISSTGTLCPHSTSTMTSHDPSLHQPLRRLKAVRLVSVRILHLRHHPRPLRNIAVHGVVMISSTSCDRIRIFFALRFSLLCIWSTLQRQIWKRILRKYLTTMLLTISLPSRRTPTHILQSLPTEDRARFRLHLCHQTHILRDPQFSTDLLALPQAQVPLPQPRPAWHSFSLSQI